MSTGPLVLVVEDDPPLRRFLCTALAAHQYRVIEAQTLGEALVAVTTHNPEAVLLDLGLPDGEGLSLVLAVREWSTLPILVISARGREADKIGALDAGADDYLTKPFATGELLARLRVALRHAALATPTEPIVEFGSIRVDLAGHVATRNGEVVRLTPTEFRLLALLVRHPGRVLTHRQMLLEVWGPNSSSHVHYVRVYMGELRRKLEDDPARPRWLLTEPGIGYRLREDSADTPPPAPRTP
ncbi:DNA-binding response regulator [Deltaproteobacteria bacterium]|nr:DNA-binding response regulator [Deltaproteobacteria bacterium]